MIVNLKKNRNIISKKEIKLLRVVDTFMRVKMTLKRVEIVLVRVVITLMRCKITHASTDN
jgi:hypothetical protein